MKGDRWTAAAVGAWGLALAAVASGWPAAGWDGLAAAAAACVTVRAMLSPRVLRPGEAAVTERDWRAAERAAREAVAAERGAGCGGTRLRPVPGGVSARHRAQ